MKTKYYNIIAAIAFGLISFKALNGQSTDTLFRGNIQEIHNVSVDKTNNHIISGIYNGNIEFKNIKDTSSSFYSGFISKYDSLNVNISNFKIEADGYFRIIKTSVLTNKGLTGLLVFNNKIRIGNVNYRSDKNWALLWFIQNDSIEGILIDSSEHFELIDFYNFNDSGSILYKRHEDSTTTYVMLDIINHEVKSSSNYSDTSVTVDCVDARILNYNKYYSVTRNNINTRINILCLENLIWNKVSFSLPSGRYLSSFETDTNLNVLFSRNDTIFVISYCIKDSVFYNGTAMVFTGDVLTVQSITLNGYRVYYGITKSFIMYDTVGIDFTNYNNSFICIDQKSDNKIDTAINLECKNIKYIVPVNIGVIIYLEELMETPGNGNELNSDGSVNRLISNISRKIHVNPKYVTSSFVSMNTIVYPNPLKSNDYLTIRFNDDWIQNEQLCIYIYNASGKYLMAINDFAINDRNMLTFKIIDDLKAGIYYIKIFNATSINSVKLQIIDK